uniref:Uncharacterized protein n=1 Tax=Rhizophora mucronata TaxID=61149 RepID=A0A2P2NSY0_RHIMU
MRQTVYSLKCVKKNWFLILSLTTPL